MPVTSHRGLRCFLLILLMLAPVLLSAPYEPPRQRPFFWADRKVSRYKVRQVTDRLVVSLPPGYVFSSHLKTLDDIRPIYVVHGEGLHLGSGYLITSHEEWHGNGARTFEGLCEWVASGPWRLMRFEARLIAGERACGSASPPFENQRKVNQRWLSCREDGCWEFWANGVEGENWLSGELVSVLDTVRFVPLPESEPDFSLGGR